MRGRSMRRISSQWTPVWSALALVFPLVVAVRVAVGFGREGKWAPVMIAPAFTIVFWLWWFFVLRHAATVFVDESGLLIRRRRGNVRVAFNQLIGIRRVTGARSEMYRVKYR